MRQITRRFLLSCAALTSIASAQAAPEMIHIPYGITKTALLPNGLDGMAVYARRDNYNAPGFGVLTIYVQQITSESEPYGFLLVPFFDKDKERFEIATGGSSECQMHGFRMVRSENKDVQLVTADREPGKSGDDVAKVTFKYFELVQNTDGVGRPKYYFDVKKTASAKDTYCDVNDAFKSELGLGPSAEGG